MKVAILLGVFAMSAALTALIRTYALRSGVMDVPSERSSHVDPTPRGGGLASIVAVILGISATTSPWGGEADRLVQALLIGCLFVATIGWVDDHRSLPSRLRLFVHAFAAAVFVAVFGGISTLQLGIGELFLGTVGAVLSWIGIVWTINLYNFMDGIDGLAAGHAVVVSIAAGVLAFIHADAVLAWMYWFLAAAAAGFLIWNWPPAKIFLGDVGSLSFGFLLAALGIAGEVRGSVPFLAWAILMAIFVTDATATLLRRAARREAIDHAHRTHAYQVPVAAGRSHTMVTSVILVGDVILATVAITATQAPRALLSTTIVVYLALALVWWRVARR